MSGRRKVMPCPCGICWKWRKQKDKGWIAEYHYIRQECSKTCVTYYSYTKSTESCWNCKYGASGAFCDYEGYMPDMNYVCDLWERREKS